MPTRENIHLAIAFDQNYLAPFFALITSIFFNNKAESITIHAIVSGLSDKLKSEIQIYAGQNHGCIDFYTIDEQTVKKFVLTSTWTSAAYYRLYFPLLVPAQVKRLLYLDTDTLVLNNLTELYNIDLEDYPVGAVYDSWVKNAPQLGIYEEGKYLNSGVLLIDIEKWNSQKVSQKAFDFLQAFPEKIKFVDQDAINAVLINNWKKLDLKFNLMYSSIPQEINQRDMKSFIADKVVLHFTLQRPWYLLCRNRFRYLYFFYLDKSPARKKQKIIDFKWSKVPDLFKIRLIEFYYDSPSLQKIWKRAKGLKQLK